MSCFIYKLGLHTSARNEIFRTMVVTGNVLFIVLCEAWRMAHRMNVYTLSLFALS